MTEPKDYTYVLPDDYELKPKTRKKLDVFVGKIGLTNIQAQQMVDLHVELVNEYATEVEKYVHGFAVVVGAISCIITAIVVSALFIIF